MSDRKDRRPPAAGRDDRSREEAQQHEFAERTGYQPAGNQVRDEPMPASRHGDKDQAAAAPTEDGPPAPGAEAGQNG
jgi:hypothetical protein